MFDIRKTQEQALHNIIKERAGEETAGQIVYGGQKEALAEDDATWVKHAMGRLEQQFDKAAVKQIRMRCQCGYGMEEKLALVKRLFAASSSLEEFAGQETAKAAGLFCSNGELYLQFPFCPCPMLAHVDRLETDAWCQCTTGYSKVLFEKAFGCEVEVELLSSVKMGDSRCLMKIIPKGAIWK